MLTKNNDIILKHAPWQQKTSCNPENHAKA
jgi:hypothetical protein